MKQVILTFEILGCLMLYPCKLNQSFLTFLHSFVKLFQNLIQNIASLFLLFLFLLCNMRQLHISSV